MGNGRLSTGLDPQCRLEYIDSVYIGTTLTDGRFIGQGLTVSWPPYYSLRLIKDENGVNKQTTRLNSPDGGEQRSENHVKFRVEDWNRLGRKFLRHVESRSWGCVIYLTVYIPDVRYFMGTGSSFASSIHLCIYLV